MVYEELSTKKVHMIADSGGYDIFMHSHLESGIVGPKGILVKAQYHSGIAGSSTRWFARGAHMQIIPELQLAITVGCGYNRLREGQFPVGVY